MRTQFLYVGLLSVIAGGFVSAGCDDNHTGQGSDPSGPVKLVRIMVQDSQPSGLLGYATDLLDTKGSPLSTAVACDDLNPCLPQFTLAGANPDFSCTKAGFCNDPLAPGQAVTITPPETGSGGEVGGDQIRLVFNKLLNNSFEQVVIDPAKLPGSNKTYKFASGVVELDGPDMMPVASYNFWDPGGAPINTSDPVNNPFGPAIVIKPLNVLAPNATYTIKVTSSMITDRKGNPMADQNGNLVSGTYTKTFTTEDITPLAATPDVTSMGAEIANNDILQVEFNTSIDFTKSTCAVTTGAAMTPVTVEIFPENGADPTACAKDTTFLDIYPVTAPGMPATAWAAGDYAIDCKIVDDQYGKGSFEYMGTFTVDAMPGDPMMDTMTVDQHVLPEMCM